MTHTKPVI